MPKKVISMSFLLLGLASFLMTAVLVSANSMTPDQPFMKAALDDLKNARKELDNAVADKGGHRANAIRLVDESIDEVKAGIDFDRNNDHAALASAESVFVEPSAITTLDQPHMRAALEYLRSARKNLDKATSDKGGHRVKAINLVNQSISEVRAGIAFAK